MKKHILIPLLLLAPLGFSASNPGYNNQNAKPKEQKESLWNNRKQYPTKKSAHTIQSQKQNYSTSNKRNQNKRALKNQIANTSNSKNYNYNRSTRMLTEANNQFNNQVYGDHYVTSRDLNHLHYIRDNIRQKKIVQNPDDFDFIIDKGRVTIVGEFKNGQEEERLVEFVQGIDGITDVTTHPVSNKPKPMESRNKIDQEVDLEKLKNEQSVLDSKDNKRLGQNFRRPLTARADADTAPKPLNPTYEETNPSDAKLQKKIEDALQNTWVRKSFKAVTVKVRNGVVMLDGTLDSKKDVQEIQNRLKNINGINEVIESFNIRN